MVIAIIEEKLHRRNLTGIKLFHFRAFGSEIAHAAIATNDLMLLIAFTPLVKFLLGTGWVSSPWDTLLFSVLLIVVIPLADGVLTEVPVMLTLVRVAKRTAGWFAPEKQA